MDIKKLENKNPKNSGSKRKTLETKKVQACGGVLKLL